MGVAQPLHAPADIHLLNASKRDLTRVFATFLSEQAKELGLTWLDPAKLK